MNVYVGDSFFGSIFVNSKPIVENDSYSFTEIRNKVYNCSSSNIFRSSNAASHIFNLTTANQITTTSSVFICFYNYAQMNDLNVSNLNGKLFHIGWNPRFYHFTNFNAFNVKSLEFLGGCSASSNDDMMNNNINLISCECPTLFEYWQGTHVFNSLNVYNCKYSLFLLAQNNPVIKIYNCYINDENSPMRDGCVYHNFEPIKEIEIHYPEYCLASFPIIYRLINFISFFVFVLIDI